MDAITYLRQEHSQFRQALSTISKIADLKIKLEKFTNFCNDLTKHEMTEEKIWYPVLRKHPELREIIKHLISEEKNASKSIKKLQQSKLDIIWRLRFFKFKLDVAHHAKEEEKELFPKVRKLLNKKELITLGKEMRKFKATLK